MAIDVSSIAVVSPTLIRVNFTEDTDGSNTLYDQGNYTITGGLIPISVSHVILPDVIHPSYLYLYIDELQTGISYTLTIHSITGIGGGGTQTITVTGISSGEVVGSATINLSDSPPVTANLWARWNARYGLYKDTAGTTPATADFDAVRLWKDQSGNGRHLQTTDPYIAGLRTPFKNGYPVVVPDAGTGSGTSLDGVTSETLVGGMTIYSVWFAALPNTYSDLIDGIGDGTNRKVLCAFGQGNLHTEFYQGIEVQGGLNTSPSGWHMQSAVFTAAGPSSQLFLDKNLEITANIGAQNLHNYRIGVDYQGSGNTRFRGYIAEQLVYNAEHDATTRQSIENWLWTKWAVDTFQPPHQDTFLVWLDPTATGGVNGNSLTSWTDKIGSFHATVPVGEVAPVWRSNQQNGLPAVDFDNILNFTSVTLNNTSFSLAQPFTVFIVVNMNGGGGSRQHVIDSQEGATNRATVYSQNGTGFRSFYAGIEANGTSWPTGWHIVSAVFDGGNSTLWMDDNQLTSDVPLLGPGNVGSGGLDGYQLGRQAVVGTPGYFKGLMGDVIIASGNLEAYGSSPVETARRQIVWALRGRWKI